MRMENLDTLLYNGRIYTMEAAGDTVEAIGIQDGKIVFAGSSEDAKAYDSRIQYLSSVTNRKMEQRNH